jgi:hypothetical protein
MVKPVCECVTYFYLADVQIIILPTIEHGRPGETPNSQVVQDKLGNHLISMYIMIKE